MNWFQRHLNWTMGLIALAWYILAVIEASGLGWLIGLVICFPLYGWILKQKKRSLWWLLILFVPFGWIVFLALENLNYSNKDEFAQLLRYLGEHYRLTTFQEKEADIYNASVTQYLPTIATDERSANEMLKIAERYRQAAHELMKRSKQLVSVPESAGALHFAWQTVFSDYMAMVDAQYATYAAIAQGNPPLVERVQTLVRQQEESHKKALKEEKKLFMRLRALGFTPSDIQNLVDKAFADTEAENWQPITSEAN